MYQHTPLHPFGPFPLSCLLPYLRNSIRAPSACYTAHTLPHPRDLRQLHIGLRHSHQYTQVERKQEEDGLQRENIINNVLWARATKHWLTSRKCIPISSQTPNYLSHLAPDISSELNLGTEDDAGIGDELKQIRDARKIRECSNSLSRSPGTAG